MNDVTVYKASLAKHVPDPIGHLKRFGIVLTTYQEVQRSVPKYDPPVHLSSPQAKDEWWQTEYETKRGPLHSLVFHRVVLDEAHMIKNADSQTSKAVRLLASKCRWALTGTPLVNGGHGTSILRYPDQF